MERATLGEFEELVLLTIAAFNSAAYGVMGASGGQIILLILYDFRRTALIGLFFSTPIALFAMDA